ncbi:MAG: proton-conducting transporter membrane subunit [Bacteriovoracaceae bacterium]
MKVELPERRGPFISVCLLLIMGLLGISLTGDLFNLYVFLEITSLAMYIILSIGGDKRAPVSVFRYLILGTLGASFYLLGVGFILLETGTLNMTNVAESLASSGLNQPAVILGVLMMIIGVAVKMAVFPLHGWLPDVYSHASSIGTSLIAPIGTKVSAYVVIRLLFFVVNPETGGFPIPIYTVIGFLGAIGIVWGSLMAVSQTDLKRMLAYSSVGQVGYIALGIGLATPLGIIGALLHTLNHACMKACLFLVSSNIYSQYGHTDIRRFDPSMRKKMRWTSAAFAVSALSMIGLPPTAGFFSKWYLVRTSVEESQWIFLVAIVLSSLLNAVYFFRILERMYLRNGLQEEETKASGVMAQGIKPSMMIGTLILGAGIFVIAYGNVWIVENLLRPITY